MHLLRFFFIGILIIIPFFQKSSLAQNDKKYQVALAGFYNVENLFDTIDDAEKRDEEFLPDGENRWDSDKYLHKLDQMSEVISKVGKDYSPDGVAILGLSEIENRQVIEDLIKMPALIDFGYQIVHYDSPDRRGVDVGLIYQKKYFEVTNSTSNQLRIEDMDEFYTRDQLVVSGKLLGDPIHFIVNHWPSRYGGEKRSRPLRNAAAVLSRQLVDSLLAIDPDAKIILMGDLNDNPNNESVKDIMRAKGDISKLAAGDLYNPMYAMYKKGIGSNAYRDTWSLFDQTLLSQGLLGEEYSTFTFYKAHIFNKGFLIQKDGRYKGYPYRSFAAGTWQGGYSDHFPVYVVLMREIE